MANVASAFPVEKLASTQVLDLILYNVILGIVVMVLAALVVKITKNYIARKIKNQDVAPVLSYDEELNAEAAEEVEA